MSGLQLCLLGRPRWRATLPQEPGQPAAASASWHPLPRKDAALLARLAMDGRQARGAIAAWLWPDVSQPRASANLRQRLYKLRQGAPQAWVEEAEDGLLLAPGVSCDVWADGCSPDAALEAVLLDGLEQATDPVQDWLDEARRRWQARRCDLMTGLASRHETAGELAAALALTERLLVLEPLLEHAWRRLMRLHALRGDRAAALAAFERCERVLRDELGVRPAAETQALLHQVETGARPLPPAVLPAQPATAATLAQQAAPALPLTLLRPPRLVGRETEWQALQQAWASGQAFMLVGEAGLGKTRLMLEMAAAGPGRVIEAARPGDERVPYAALVRLLRSMARVATRPDALWPAGPANADAEADPADRQERQALARLLPELGPIPAAPGLETLLHAAVEQVFLRAPAAGLQAVLFDDLHHADEATRTVLRHVSTVPGLHWGLASRPDDSDALARWLTSSARVLPVPLRGLDEAALLALLQACALPGIDPAAMAPALARHCGGNPLFVLETLRQHLLDGGGLPPAALAPLPLPASVEALLAQRLAALPADAQAVARVAAVAGPDFDAEVAADVLQQPLLALAEPLAALEQAQVMREGRFAHDTLREAVLRNLPAVMKRPLHARVALSLRGRGAPAARVAAHFDAGGMPADAAAMAMVAAAEDRRLGRLAERVDRLAQAQRWFEQAGHDEGLLEARLESVHARFASEGPTPDVMSLTDALLQQAVRRETRVYVHLLRSGLSLSRYDLVQGLDSAMQAVAEAEPGSDDELSASLLSAAAQALGGDTTAALARVQPLQARLQGFGDPLKATNLWGYLAMVFGQSGRPDECIAALQVQRRLAREVGKADDEATALTSLCGQYAQRGEPELALAVGRESLALHRRMGAAHGMLGAALNLALAQIGLWHLREALITLADARQSMELVGTQGELRCITDDAEAEIWLRACQPARALELTGLQGLDGVSAARVAGRKAQHARALQAVGDTAAAQALWQEVLQGVPGPQLWLRLQLLAVQGLAGLADDRLPALCAAKASQPHSVRALMDWVQGAAALRCGDAGTALTCARQLRDRLGPARHAHFPEAEVRAWCARTLGDLAPSAEAEAAREAHRQWLEEVWQPAVAALAGPALEGSLPGA